MEHPEAQLQKSVRQFLVYCLPENIRWTASLVGVNLRPAARARAKSAGVQPGWPDLAFLYPNGVTYYIELKSKTGSLSLEQREFRDCCAPHGIWALCRSLDEVEAALRGWGAELRSHPFAEIAA